MRCCIPGSALGEDDCRALTVECDERLVTTFKRTFADITFVPRRRRRLKLERRGFDYQRIGPDGGVLRRANSLSDCRFVGRRGLAANGWPRGCARIRRGLPIGAYLAETFGDRLTVGVAWRSGLRTRLRDQQYLTPEELARALPPGSP